MDAQVKIKLASVGQLACSTKWSCGPLEEVVGPISHGWTLGTRAYFRWAKANVSKAKGGGGGGGSCWEEHLLLGNQ